MKWATAEDKKISFAATRYIKVSYLKTASKRRVTSIVEHSLITVLGV